MGDRLRTFFGRLVVRFGHQSPAAARMRGLARPGVLLTTVVGFGLIAAIAVVAQVPMYSITLLDAVTGDNPTQDFTVPGVTCNDCYVPDPNPGVDSYTSDIAAVKRAKTLPGQTNEELVMDLAGARASIEWTAEPSKVYDSDDIIAVTAEINRLGQAGQRSKVELVYLHNRQTKKISFEERLNGARQDLLSGALNLMLLDQFKLQLQ